MVYGNTAQQGGAGIPPMSEAAIFSGAAPMDAPLSQASPSAAGTGGASGGMMQKNPRIALYLLLLLILGGGYYGYEMFMDESSSEESGGIASLLSEPTPPSGLTPSPDSAAAPGGAGAEGNLSIASAADGGSFAEGEEENAEGGLEGEEDAAEGEGVLDVATAETDSDVLGFSEITKGPNADDKAWEALDTIKTWAVTEGGYPENVLMQYLVHRKLWVRLSALSFAVRTDEFDEVFLKDAAAQIVTQFNRGQITRFMERYRRTDIAHYAALIALLRI